MSKQAKPAKAIDGLLILDKPAGLTSNKCLQIVKHLLGAAKAGHTGALDPLASGVLPLCFGEATKISQFLLDSDKAYEACIRLGLTTTTGDSEGEPLVETPVPALARAEVEAAVNRFLGTITQVPPIYSALKQDGVPLYKLARAGKHIEPKSREVCIHSIRLKRWDSPELEIEVSCSKGTYIRTLAEDIGRALGTGGHITALRRSKAGPFGLGDCLTLEQLQALAQIPGELEKRLIAADAAIADLPAIVLSEADALCLRQGKAVPMPGSAPQDTARLYIASEFIGLGELRADGRLVSRRLLRHDS